jgi:signal transduction histidine kinase
LGLGLSICRSIIEGHGGQFGVDSTSGQGSSFWFALPCMATQALDDAGESEALAPLPSEGVL